MIVIKGIELKISKSIAILLFLFLASINIWAQSFEIGHTTLSFFDSSREREIETQIYYPSDIAGDDEAIANGSFPVIVFGHGFLMSWDSYQNFWEELVPKGYVLCFPTTESNFTPNHADFGQDLAFVIGQMQLENNDENSPLFNSIADKTGLMGHSMGGGASFLAAENNSTVTTLINFAAAETTPSAISAASNTSTPALVFSGDDDCVAPEIDNQDPLYTNLASECKTHIKIVNGGHCYFANENTTCEFGESFCNPGLVITREEQQAVTFNFLNLWLDYWLYDDEEAWEEFNNNLPVSNAINYSQECVTTGLDDSEFEFSLHVFPNPASDFLHISWNSNTTNQISILDSQGRTIYQSTYTGINHTIEIVDFPSGMYILRCTNGESQFNNRFIKI